MSVRPYQMNQLFSAPEPLLTSYLLILSITKRGLLKSATYNYRFLCVSIQFWQFSYIREGNGTLLQYSCLENPMDGGAWQAAVHGVAKSQTRLSNFTFMHCRRKQQPTPVFLPGESQGQGSLVGCRLWGRTESDMTEVTQQQFSCMSFTAFLFGTYALKLFCHLCEFVLLLLVNVPLFLW